jgi:hypothetical protein
MDAVYGVLIQIQDQPINDLKIKRGWSIQQRLSRCEDEDGRDLFVPGRAAL